MSLPTLAKTWQFNINQAYAAPGSVTNLNKTALLALKNSLIGFASNPFTIGYSCNGSTAGTANDGVDRWAAIADVVFGNPGATHSWVVLKQPAIAAGFQILISASAEADSAGVAYATQLAISIYVSRSAGFTGGSKTARPTATDEQTVKEIGGSTGRWGGINATNLALRVHALMSTDGLCTRVFFASSGVVWGAFTLDAVSNTTDASWSPAWHARLHSKLSSGTFPQSLSTAMYYAYDGAIFFNGTASTAALTAESRGGTFGPDDNGFAAMANDADGNWLFFPIGLVSATMGARGRLGTMIDIWWGSSAVPSGDRYDATSKSFAQLGPWIVPWDGSSAVALT